MKNILTLFFTPTIGYVYLRWIIRQINMILPPIRAILVSSIMNLTKDKPSFS